MKSRLINTGCNQAQYFVDLQIQNQNALPIAHSKFLRILGGMNFSKVTATVAIKHMPRANFIVDWHEHTSDLVLPLYLKVQIEWAINILDEVTRQYQANCPSSTGLHEQRYSCKRCYGVCQSSSSSHRASHS